MFSNVSTSFPDLSILKSLLAGLKLPWQGATPDATPDSGTMLYPTRSASPWLPAHLAPNLQRIKRNNYDGKFTVFS